MLEVSGQDVESIPAWATTHFDACFHSLKLANKLLKKLFLEWNIRVIELHLIEERSYECSILAVPETHLLIVAEILLV